MLRIDNCKYCAAVTHTNYDNISDLLNDIETGEAGCWLCMEDGEDGEHHTEFDVYDSGKKIWCGHKQKCNDITGEEPQQQRLQKEEAIEEAKKHIVSKRKPCIIGSSRNSKGFTLLEIIVVVFILSILTAVIAPKIIGRTDDARIAEAKVQIKNFETALKLFKIDNGFYPDTQQGLESLIEKPTSGQIPKKYRADGYLEQKKIPIDPWGNPYMYLSPGLHSDFDIMSYGADGKEGGEGKDADIKNWDSSR